MTPWGAIVLGCGYIFGLLSTGIVIGGLEPPMVSYGLLLLGAGLGSWMPKRWRLGPTGRQWLLAGIIGLLGALYCLWRIPQPAVDDVSWYGPGSYRVYGEVMALPQVNRSGKGKFWLKAHGIQHQGDNADFVSRQVASGKVYVTAPLELTDGLRPGQDIKVVGKLYKPSAAAAPGEFDFKAYLARQGSFAGLSAYRIDELLNTERPNYGLWQVRQRIVTAQSRWLGDKGTLVSAMILGRRAVDLPYDIRDAFIEAGLAHTLAASGFHVALVLGLVLALLSRQPVQTQALGGCVALVMYVGLTGLQASVMRAAVMGAGAMLGLALDQRAKPLSCLGLAAFLLLLWNPRWIWDIGFQLSVSATLGLILMASSVARRLDWLPGAIATLLSVPIAAYIWTLPLQLYHFGTVSSYSIVLNTIATPLVTIVSLGGFISATVSLIWPLGGSAIAWLLAIPVQLLMALVSLFNQLPGHQLVVGNIPAWLVAVAYGIYGIIAIWFNNHSQTV